MYPCVVSVNETHAITHVEFWPYHKYACKYSGNLSQLDV